jgi:glucarate dehydratase
MCTTAFEGLPGSIRLGSENIVLCDHHYWGGPRASLDLARICHIFGRGLSMYSNSHLGISLAAMTHLGGAIPNLMFACDPPSNQLACHSEAERDHYPLCF